MFRHFQPAEPKGKTACPYCGEPIGSRTRICPNCGEQLRGKIKYVRALNKIKQTRKNPKPEAAAAPKAFRKIRGGPPPPSAAADAAKFEDDLGTPEEWRPMYKTAQSKADSLNQQLKEAIEKMTKAEGITYLQHTVDAFVQEDPFLAEQVLKETLRLTP
jgi:hypothetical protein